MGKFYRFLSVLMLVSCLSVPMFTPRTAAAWPEWLDDLGDAAVKTFDKGLKAGAEFVENVETAVVAKGREWFAGEDAETAERKARESVTAANDLAGQTLVQVPGVLKDAVDAAGEVLIGESVYGSTWGDCTRLEDAAKKNCNGDIGYFLRLEALDLLHGNPQSDLYKNAIKYPHGKECASYLASLKATLDELCAQKVYKESACRSELLAVEEAQKRGTECREAFDQLSTFQQITDSFLVTRIIKAKWNEVTGTGQAIVGLFTGDFSGAARDFEAASDRYRGKTPTGGKGDIAARYTDILRNFMTANSDGTVNVGCWFCPIFKTIFTTVNTLATELYNKLRDLFLALLAISGMAWLLWTVFRFITTIHGPNIGEFVTKLFKGLGTIMILAIILRAPPSFITRYIVDPVAIFGAELSSEITRILSGDNSDTVSFNTYSKKDYCGVKTTMKDSSPTVLKICTKADAKEFEGKALSADVYDSMNCLLRRVSVELIFGIALGAALIANGMSGGSYGLPQFDVLLVGIIVLFSYLCLYISVPFKLIDLLLRLGFVIILLPLFVVCMASPATRMYSKKGWDMFMSCWISLISLCLFVTLALTIMGSALSQGK